MDLEQQFEIGKLFLSVTQEQQAMFLYCAQNGHRINIIYMQRTAVNLATARIITTTMQLQH